MEGLKKLEQVQRTISFMQSHGIFVSPDIRNPNRNPDSDRFLANLVLLLVQPCGELDLDTKCQLILKFLPEISTPFFKEALEGIVGEGNTQIETAAMFDFDDKADVGAIQICSEDMALVGFGAIQRANSTLEDFCRSYFMFHEMDSNRSQSIFKYLPVLSFTESYIYQLDRLNEKLLQLPTNRVSALDGESDADTNGCSIYRSMKLLPTDPFRPLAVLLEHHGLLTERIREEFRSGEEYWDLERKLCHALVSKNEIRIEDVIKAIHLKSFDYRVLNLLLYQLRGEKVNELHMEFLSASELLVEVSDDLFDYEDDVVENNFNILRMFVGIHGASAAATRLAKFISEAEEEYEKLLKGLDPRLAMNYQKRCEEATAEGGKLTGPSLGTWNLPPVIEDEDSYRWQYLKSRPSVVESSTCSYEESFFKSNAETPI